MEKQLFNPRRIETSNTLILNPFFWDARYYEDLKKRCQYHFPLIQTEMLVFDGYSLISGFLGYSHILTMLEFVEGVRQKEIYFLGTAGSLSAAIDEPCICNVREIYASAIFEHFSSEKSLDMVEWDTGEIKKVKGVSVDLIQRETSEWLREQEKEGIDIVEMEIFPLRVYLEKPFSAMVVLTDRVAHSGAREFTDKKKFQQEFVRAYEIIVRKIHETGGHLNP
jgi:hypothetical protein